MNKTVAALQRLFMELGGDLAKVKDCKTTVEVLNAISEKYDGEGGAKLTAKAIDNIANVAGNIGGGGEPEKYTVSFDEGSAYYLHLVSIGIRHSFAAGETLIVQVEAPNVPTSKVLMNGSPLNSGFRVITIEDGHSTYFVMVMPAENVVFSTIE